MKPRNISVKRIKEMLILYHSSVCVNSNAWPKKLPSGSFEQIGNKTECALLEMAANFGYDYTKYRDERVNL